MAEGVEIASLFATLGLTVNSGQWAQGNAAIHGARKAVGGLNVAFQDGQGRWRTASGGYLSVGEKAQLASRGVKGLGDAAEEAGKKAARAGEGAGKSFDAAGAALKGYLVYLGGHLGYEKLIKFNADQQSSIIGLSAIIEGNLGGSFAEATAQSKELYAEFQKFSTKTPVTTAEILDFGRAVSAATFQAGGKIKDLQQITEQGVIAAKVLAPDRGAGYASLEISELLQGNISNRQVFAKQLLGLIKVSEEQFRGFDAKQRLATVQRALSSPALKDAAGAFQDSFAGVTSTLEDKLQITFGKIGLPLFEAITKAVVRFNQWLDDNADTIERVGQVIGTALGQAFEFLSDVISVVIEKGGEVLTWLAQFIDGGDLITSLLYAIGAALLVFAAQSVIAFASNPITLIILAVTALIYLIQRLVKYPGGVGKAFDDAFAEIRRAAGELWDAIKKGFEIVFDEVADLPVVKQILAAGKKILDFFGTNSAPKNETERAALHTGLVQSGALSPAALPSGAAPVSDIQRQLIESGALPASAGRTAAPRFAPTAPTSVNVSVGDIHVNAPNADPVAVGDQVRKMFHEELGGVLRQTMDVYG